MLPLNDDPCNEKGCELNPPPAVAVPVVGNRSAPREIIGMDAVSAGVAMPAG